MGGFIGFWVGGRRRSRLELEKVKVFERVGGVVSGRRWGFEFEGEIGFVI